MIINKRFWGVFLSIFMGVLASGVNAQQNGYVAGEDYVITAADSSDEPMVEEFFNYACGACYSMEGFVTELKKNNPNLKVKKIPLELRPSWKIYVKAYYIGEKLGILEQSHGKIFHRLHVEKRHFKDEDDMKSFFLDLGVEEKAYDDIAKSYWLNTQLRSSKQYAMKHKIASTPVFLVNKRYKLDSTKLAGVDRIEGAIKTLSGLNATQQ